MLYIWLGTNCFFMLLLSCSSFLTVTRFVRRPTLLEEYTGYIIFRKTAKDERQYLLIKKPKKEHWEPPEAPTIYATTPRTEKDEEEEESDTTGEEEEEAGATTAAVVEPRPYELYEQTGLMNQNVTFIPYFSRSYEYFTDKARVEVTYTMAKIRNPDVKIRLPLRKSEYKWVPVNDVFNMTDDTRQKAFDDAEEYLRRGGYNVYF